jgi:uncharacterized membrane protein YccC
MRASSALGRLLRDAARLDRTQSDPVVALRNAIGVAAPLAIGALMGSASIGLPSAIGALQTGFADRPGPYRLRMLRMSGAALATAVTSAVAVALSRNDVASAALVLVLGFCAGLLISGGPAAAQVGIAATAVALILGHQPQPASVAVHVGLLVLAGGAGQVLLAVAAWPLGRHRPERVALAGLYRALANLARQPPATSVGPPLGEKLSAVRQTLYGVGHDHGPSVEAYRVLLDGAERIRGEVIVLAGQVVPLDRREGRVGADAVRSVLAAAAITFHAIAGALEQARPVDEQALAPVRGEVDAALAVLAGQGLAGRSVAARVRVFTGELRAAVETARTGAGEGSDPERDDVRGVARLRDPIAVLRANLNPDAAVLRHAIRAAVLVAGSDAVVRLNSVPRGYWIPLTIMVTLRPDFATTFQRSSMRVLGTIVGLVLATLLIHFVPGGQWWSVVLVGVFFFGVRFAGPGNIALLAVSLAALVVVLLSLAGQSPHSTVIPRGVDTLIGGALALLGTLLWPVWERRRVPDRLAALLDAYLGYLDALADPDATQERLRRLRSAARLARSNAQASVDAARADPVSSQGQVDLGEAVLAHTHRFVHALLTVDALRDTVRLPPELTDACRDVLISCRTAILSGTAPKRAPRIRPVQQRFVDSAGEDAAALVEASDRIANSLDTLTAELRRQADDLASTV